MSDEPIQHLEANSDDDPVSDDEEEGVVSIQTALLPSDGKNAYRIRNSSGAEAYQRTTGSDFRKGAVRIRCKVLDIVHGTLSPDQKDSFATLIVFKCAFYSKSHSRRAASVDFELVFKGLGLNAPDPEVLDIAPQGKYCLMPETKQVTVTHEASGGVNASAGSGAGVQGLLKWQKVGVREKKKYTTVIGEAGLYGRDEGEDDGVAWTLLENPLSKDGVPETFGGAVLLKRKDAMSHFQCDVKITAKTDRWTTISKLFESPPVDDPILFDPRLPSTDKRRVYTTNRLGEVNLKDFEDISIMKVKSGIVNEDPPAPKEQD